MVTQVPKFTLEVLEEFYFSQYGLFVSTSSLFMLV